MRRLIGKVALYAWHTTVCIAVFAFIVTAFWAVSYGISVHRRHQAEALLQELKALQPGAVSLRTVHQIEKQFGGVKHCTGQLCSYDFRIGFAYSPSPIWRRTEWDYVGLRPWQVSANIQVRNDVVTNVEWLAVVARGRGWLYNKGLFSGNEWAWLDISGIVSSERFDQEVNFLQESVEKDAALVVKPHLTVPGGGERLEVFLTPTATPESRAIAFDIDLRCATALLSCTHLCQLAPAAWQSYSQSYKSHGWWVADAEECTAP